MALPEYENSLECRAFERIHDAGDDAMLNAAWQQAVAEFNVAALRVTRAVISSDESRLSQADHTAAPSQSDAEWLVGYDRAE